MVNSHNLCIFEGRIIKDPEYTQVQTVNGPMDKATFTIAVDKAMSAKQRQAAQNDPNAQTADFINCSLIGNAVNTFKQYCPKGKAITVTTSYSTYKYTNNQTGQTQYGHNFNVEDFKFTVADAKNMAQNGTGNNNGGYQQNNGYGQNNYNNNGGYQQNNGYGQQQNNNFMNAPQAQNNGNFEMFDNSNSASPF